MAAAEPKIILLSLEENINQLITEHQKLSKQNRELTSQRDQLLLQKRELQEKVKSLEKSIALNELTDGLSKATKSNKKAKSYINRLMREVDSCINLLSTPGQLKDDEQEPSGNE